MSKFNFSGKAAVVDSVMKNAMQEVAFMTRNEFVRNIDKGSFDGKKWKKLKRQVPPPPLDVTGELKTATEESIRSISATKIVMVNDVRDDRGRSYGGYHNEGTPNMPQRAFMKQTDRLTRKQLQILKQETGKIWQVA